MVKSRPYYLNLAQLRLPIGGWVSILHRVSGAMLSLTAPVLLYGFMLSLRSPQDFETVKGFLASGLGLLVLLGLGWATLHHFFAGLRHLGFDLGWGEERLRARQTAILVLVLGAGLTALLALEVF